ncbi:carbohydrate ABC transporter permease [Poriferisphaera sp. WC338]|uniref:carbohydrate ABC transporter permease n=1 Tax=Poriferisphaera sp. WC338 TaxID=3425129 RepID=UPI003D81A653
MSNNTSQCQKSRYTVLVYLALGVFAIFTLMPFAYLLCSAFKSSDVFFSSSFLPIKEDGYWFEIEWSGLTLNHFHRLWSEVNIGDAPFVRSVFNSLFFASTLSLLATLGSAMGGYALAMMRFRGQETITYAVLGCIVIPGTLLLAPSYVVLHWLGLLDTYTGLILPGIAPAFGVYLFRQAFIGSLPVELLEASSIDGCNDLRMFLQIALPMVRPMIGAFLLITYLGAWNNFIGPQIVLQTPEKFPLAVAVAQLRGNYGIEHGMIMAGTLIAVAPVLILFLMLQRDFISGLTTGSVKG